MDSPTRRLALALGKLLDPTLPLLVLDFPADSHLALALGKLPGPALPLPALDFPADKRRAWDNWAVVAYRARFPGQVRYTRGTAALDLLANAYPRMAFPLRSGPLLADAHHERPVQAPD
jgi:hypothetical protein